MKRLLASLLAALLLILPAAPAAAKYDYLRSVYPLQALSMNEDTGRLALANICTVSSINQERQLWLTAAHCVGTWLTGPVDDDPRYIDGYQVEVFKVDFERDLAILKAPHSRVPGLRLQPFDVSLGQSLIVAGHPFGLPPLFVTQGYVAVVRGQLDADGPDYMMYDVAGAPGNSGSPVFNKHGEIVSVLQIGFGGYSPVTGGAPWRALRSFAGSLFED